MTKRLSNLTPVPISELLGRSFFVPKYQRGYRWTARQVTDLLDDVLAFVEKPTGAFYCLQPIVVADAGGRCDLIDGQQRLTTLSLILTYFNSRFTEDEAWNTFSLEYETRETSRAYLAKPDPERKDDNVDFHHIHHAYEAIKNWFALRRNLRNDMESAFLNKVKIIWYEVDTAEDPIAIFTRLNIGKIPLTNAELVKGLFLRASNFACGEPVLCQMKQAKIAQEWDDIERRLQEDSFWYFLTNRTMTSNRIDFLLRLRADEVATGHVRPDDPSYVFLTFAEHLNRDGIDHTAEWARIKQLFLHLDEWYRDREFYHLIGFLTATGAAIPDVKKLGHGRTKRAFRAALKSLILKQVLGRHIAPDPGMLAPALQEHLDDLDYDIAKTRPDIKEALLLFNIATLLESDKVKARFPFDLFKGEAWDIEHVRAVHSALPDAVEGARKWLATMLTYATGRNTASDWAEAIAAAPAMQHADLCLRALRLLEKEPFNKEQFALLAGELIEHYDPDPDREADNTIGNLTLLDAATNRSYKNAVFPAKRKTLIALDKSGTFVPVCTKNVFLKYYSPRIDGMLVWTGEDAAAHQTAMHETLVRFFENSEMKV
jgi:hypothetical protein